MSNTRLSTITPRSRIPWHAEEQEEGARNHILTGGLQFVANQSDMTGAKSRNTGPMCLFSNENPERRASMTFDKRPSQFRRISRDERNVFRHHYSHDFTCGPVWRAQKGSNWCATGIVHHHHNDHLEELEAVRNPDRPQIPFRRA